MKHKAWVENKSPLDPRGSRKIYFRLSRKGIGQMTAAPVAALTQGVLQAMYSTKLKMTAALLAGTALLAGWGLFTQPVLADKPPRASKLDLTPESFPKLQALIKPQEDEWRLHKVQWLTDIVAAREKAAQEDKPIVVQIPSAAGYHDHMGPC